MNISNYLQRAFKNNQIVIYVPDNIQIFDVVYRDCGPCGNCGMGNFLILDDEELQYNDFRILSKEKYAQELKDKEDSKKILERAYRYRHFVWLANGDIDLAAKLARMGRDEFMELFVNADCAERAFCGRPSDWKPEDSLAN